MAVEVLKDRFTVANDFVRKTFVLEKGRLTSFSLTDICSGQTLTPRAGSELFVLHFAGAFGGEWIRASELKVQDALPGEDVCGCRLKIFFKPVRVRGCKLEIQYTETLQRMDHFLCANLTLVCSGGEKAVLDFLDFAPLRVEASDFVHGVRLPEKEKDGAVYPRLGQPVFVENAFFGCAFPAALAGVGADCVQVRRYYGRSLAALCGESGSFVSDSFVSGVASARGYPSVRAAFFRCLETVLPPAQAQNVLAFPPVPLGEAAVQTLLTHDKRMQRAGARFFDSVLLEKQQVFPDDAPFAFSQEVPLALREFCGVVSALGAAPGLAVGASAAQKGFFRRRQAPTVCLADEGMLASLQDFVLLLAETCGVTDWQFTLSADKPCREKTHAHPVGGEHQLYYYSALFEAWINLFSVLKKNAKVPLRVSLCGVPLSPWLLQWADALALAPKVQNGAAPALARMAYDAALLDSFADGVCVPPERLFSPVPAGQIPSVPFSPSGALRALYTPQDDCDAAALLRRAVNRVALRPLLRRTVPFGGDARFGDCCGFAAFDSAEGLLTLRNPTSAPREMTLTLDETLGVPKRFLCVGVCALHPQASRLSSGTLHYGDHLTQTLSPFETVILHLGASKTPPQLCFAEAKDSVTLRLRFLRPVSLENIRCAQNPVRGAVPDADGCGGLLTLTYPFAPQNRLVLENVQDGFGTGADVPVEFMFAENGLLPPGLLSGPGAFTLKVTFGSEENLQMYLQTERLLLAAEDGHVTFRVGDAVLRSRARTDNAVQVCAVRERSGTLKLYLNGVLDGSLPPMSPPTSLAAAAPLCFDEKRTRLYARALAFDEV